MRPVVSTYQEIVRETLLTLVGALGADVVLAWGTCWELSLLGTLCVSASGGPLLYASWSVDPRCREFSIPVRFSGECFFFGLTVAVLNLLMDVMVQVISSVIRIGRLPAVRRVDAGPTSRVRGGYASKARVAECLHVVPLVCLEALPHPLPSD